MERPSTDDEKPKRILTGAELALLLDAVADRHRVLFDLMAETGGRLAEVLGIVWEDVDLTAETVRFDCQLDRRRQRVRLKTKSSRRVLEVTPRLVSRLRAHKLASPCGGPHDLVFANRAGIGHDHRNVGGRVLARAVEKAGLGAVEDRAGTVVVEAPTCHSLRHTHASALIAAGWDIAEVSARLGHASVATTMAIYVHAFDEANRSGDRRARLASMYSPVEAPMEAQGRNTRQQTPPVEAVETRSLRAVGD